MYLQNQIRTVGLRCFFVWSRLNFLMLLCGALAVMSFPALADDDPPSPYERLTLLVPDGADLNSWQIKVWMEAAAEEGLQMSTMTDSAFLALGTKRARRIGGLVLPDSAHIQGSDALVNAVKQYVRDGGQLLLTYDAASQTEAGVPPAIGRSRFSDLVGVEYVLSDSLRDRVVGFGPVVGVRAKLHNMGVPPGKYVPHTSPNPNLRSASFYSTFVPTQRMDPGGQSYLRPYMVARGYGHKNLPYLMLRHDRSVNDATPSMAQVIGQIGRGDVAAIAREASVTNDSPNEISWIEGQEANTASENNLQAVSGYGYGALSYPTFVTTGTFPGTTFLASPEFGLVAGVRTVERSGRVLFVNLPLGYLKAIGTDGMLLQGFLNKFARDLVVMPRLSVQPQGVGGLIYNWHVDDGDDIVPDMTTLLNLAFIRQSGPFSIHFTAGPDTSELGDRQGMNLPNNPVAQDAVRRAGALYPYTSWATPAKRNALGSHGGWNHNIYGIQANESNEATYLPWVSMNFSAIENVTGQRIREYSAPQGNNPSWAVRWLEQRGVVSMYTLSNTGAAAVREWRDGQRLTSKLWAAPVATFGQYATFEEFNEYGVSNASVVQWLVDLQSFVVNQRSNRLFYSHPPGMRDNLGVVKTFINRGRQLETAGRFKWYTMAQMADFSERRIQTTWTTSVDDDETTIEAYNPQGLTDVTWLIPRSRYNEKPDIKKGNARITSDSTHWIVTATGGTTLKFEIEVDD